ncbi:MAG TPA: DUF4139 domain-containing protein [Kofleriaceae bacterium]|nr:DUF4139 domain-containing protein [Kofleriaceae bacterium]
MRADTDSLILGALVVAAAAQAVAGTGPRTQITVWAATPSPAGIYGGLAYGGSPPTSGAMITEQRVVDVTTGEARIAGVAATLDPASVQLRDLSDAAAQVTEQRFLPGAATPTEILARHLGDPVVVATPRGEVSGALRAVDDQAIVVEIGSGDQRHLQVMRRDAYVQDVRLPASAGGDKPSLAWRLRGARSGKHTVEVTYRADGMSWSADYLAVLDDAGKAIDFSAWATIKNATGASYDGAELTLVSGGAAAVRPGAAGRPPPARFVVPAPVRIGHGEAVQVELVPPRARAPARSVILFEAMADPSPNFQAYPGVDCNQFNGASGSGRAEIAVEIDVPAQSVLPEGRVRLFQRRAGRLEVLTEDPLRASAGLARIRVSPDTDVTGERRAVTCNYDEPAHTIHETVEVKVENKGKQPADVVVREFLWRWPVWHLEAEDRRGVRAAPQIQEYRLRVPPGGRQAVTYTAVYSW